MNDKLEEVKENKPVRKGAGRKPKIFDDSKKENFLQALRIGNTLDSACAFADLSEGVVKYWLKQGAMEIQRAEMEAIKNNRTELTYIRSQKHFADFVMECRKAMAVGETRDLQIIAAASQQNWQAAAWRRERMQPEKYGRRTVQHTGDVKVTHGVDPQLRRQAMEIVEQKEKIKAVNEDRPK